MTNRIGRGERIRTSDSCVPNAVLYQAELRPVGLANFIMLRMPLTFIYRFCLNAKVAHFCSPTSLQLYFFVRSFAFFRGQYSHRNTARLPIDLA